MMFDRGKKRRDDLVHIGRIDDGTGLEGVFVRQRLEQATMRNCTAQTPTSLRGAVPSSQASII